VVVRGVLVGVLEAAVYIAAVSKTTRMSSRDGRYVSVTRRLRANFSCSVWSGAALALLAFGCGDDARSGEQTRDDGATREEGGTLDGGDTREGGAMREGGATSDGGVMREGGATNDGAAATNDGAVAADAGEVRDDAMQTPGARVWETAEVVEETRLSYVAHAVADARANLVVVWDDLEGKVRSKVYDHESATWSASVLLDPDNSEDSAIPSIAIDANGNVLAVWQRQSQQTDDRTVWSSRYDAGKRTWSQATRIENSEFVLAPDVAVDGAGNGVLVFTVAQLGVSGAYARFDASTGSWSAAEAVSKDRQPFAGPRLMTLADGRGVSLWTVGNYMRGDIWAADYDTRVGTWTNMKKLSPAAGAVLATGVAMNAKGQAVGVWTREEGEALVVWASVRSPEGVWQNPQRIDRQDGGSALEPRVTIDERGDIVCVWSADKDGRQSVWMNRYVASRGAFQGAEPIDAPDNASAMAPVLALDGQGNAFAIWLREKASSRTVWGARLQTSAPAFEPAQQLRSRLGGDASNLELTVMPDGRALALWSEAGERLVASWFR
jgi:hypothetical protein